MSPKKYRIPRELEMVHAYHQDFQKLIEHNTKLNIENLKMNKTNKYRLFVRQKGKCGMCGLTLMDDRGEFNYEGSIHLHHKVPRGKGGAKGDLSNITLVHMQCHMTHHKTG